MISKFNKILGLSCACVLLSSCYKEDIEPPLPPQPIITNPVVIDTAINMVGESWVITGYRVGEFGDILSTNDTLVFMDLNSYTFNGNEFTYSFYTTASAYNLTINYTPWGNLSGTIYDGNVLNGVINGLKFSDITMGSGTQTNYYLWMYKL